MSVRFVTAAALVHELMEARDERRVLRLQKQLANHKLLIIDELGFVPLSKTGAELLFELVSQRYERAAVLITSNLPFDEWTETFGSERLTEMRAGGAKSVFHFDVPGQVAHSTHAGLPWLRSVRRKLADPVHFWPFDGWEVPPGRSAVVEVYPSLWRDEFPKDEKRTGDQHDAYCIAAWLSRADGNDTLPRYLTPKLSPSEADQARVEGWILGVGG